jgi:ribose transport system ATP-binding protein
MARKMVGRELNQIYPEKSTPLPDVVMSVRDLSVKGLVNSVNFDLHRGEVLGFAGLIGAGRTEMAEGIMGLRSRQTGDIRINGKPALLRSPREAVETGLAYLSEDRQGKGLIMNFDIPQNITLISLHKYIRGLISRKREVSQAREYVKRFDIKAASLQTHLINLSGGNQQKVYLSKWMDTEPEILILDEPTRGIDVNTKKEIYHFIQSLTDHGLAVIVISSEMEEIIGLANRVVVMRAGSVMGTLEGEDINEEEIMYYAAGLKKSVA